MVVDVSATVVDFLRAELDPAAVPVPFDVADDVGFAEYDRAIDYPFVAAVSEDPVVVGGGNTAFTALGADGGPVQDRVWLVTIDCWGGPIDDDVYQSAGSHPDKVANALGHLVADAANDAAEAGAPDGVAWISAEPPVTANDTDREPTHYRRQVTVRAKTTYQQ